MIPNIYTDDDLIEFMWHELQAVAAAVDLNRDCLTEAVNDVLLDYGVTTLADAVDIKKVRAIARYYAWLAALKQVSADYQFSESGVSYARQQALDGLEKMVARVKREAGSYLSGYVIGVGDVVHTEDPYKRYTVVDL